MVRICCCRAFFLLTFLSRLQVIPSSPTFTEWAETPDGSAIQLTPASAGPHRLLFWQIPSAGYTTLVGRLSSSSGGRIGLSARTSQDGSTAVDVVLDISADGQTATPSVCVLHRGWSGYAAIFEYFVRLIKLSVCVAAQRTAVADPAASHALRHDL